MALVLKDRVKETTTTTGTGTYTLAGAVTGYQSFSVVGDGNTTYYTVTDGTNWEVGIGTYTASGSSLSRDTILESSNAGSAVNWGAGSKDVFLTYPAEKAVTADGVNPFTSPVLVNVNSTSNALEIRQIGTGNALLVEDATNPDATPTVVDFAGNIIVGKSSRTTSISSKIEIHSTSGEGVSPGLSPSLAFYNWNATGSVSSNLSFFHSPSGTVGTFVANSLGDTLGQIHFWTRDGAGDYYSGSIIGTANSTVADVVDISYTAYNHKFTGPITQGTWNGSAIGVTYGGTGQTTQTAAFDALSPATTKGDLIVDNGTNNVRLPVGTDGYVLTADAASTEGVKWAAAGGGVSPITISNKTGAYTVVAGDLGTIINCTSGTFTVSLTAAATLGSGFNCWIWNTGTGVITIDPNGTETVDGVDPTTEFKINQGTGVRLVCTGAAWLTGDIRTSGTSSIGVLGTQIGRNSAGNMAVATTGQGAMALGGSYASGTDSFAAAVANNTSTYGAKGANSIAIGYLNNVTGNNSVAIGYAAIASGTNATAIGRSLTASQDGAVALGVNSQSAIIGKLAFAYWFSSAQYGLFVLYKQTTDATPAVLTTDNSSPGTNDQVILPNNSAYAFTGTVVARQQASGGTASAAWKIEGLIRREANAASTTLVASTVTAIDNTPGWTLALSADTTNGGLKVEATGAAATNIRWVATVQTSEVTYA